MEVTAEGVEETAQLTELRTYGCSSVQGYLFAEPMTASDVEQLFREHGGAIQKVA
jgi:EAL domain-containing protein (putative c-di-GMP-specific phosphodiesterase class I)